MALKQYKESENKVYEQLYDNLFFLSHFYPTSRNFNVIFKRDMFVKSNKAAFFEVAYYLLNTLNGDLTKQKITTWPPYDIKRENKFRAEVLQYINELNVIYSYADIPHIMSSHLISPGGFKFTRFMLKLSQLVIYEHLKKTEKNDILHCPKPSKDVNLTKATINNLKRKTIAIETETRQVINEFQSYHFQLNEKAISLSNELTEINNKIHEAKKRNSEVSEEFSKKYSSYPSFTILEEKIKLLKDEWNHLQENQNLLLECEKLISYLNSNELVLEHCKEELNVPSEISHIMRNENELDLKEFFHALNALLKEKSLELPHLTNFFISHNIEKVENLIEQYTELINALSENSSKLQVIINKLLSDPKEHTKSVEGEETEEILALPLIDSHQLN